MTDHRFFNIIIWKVWTPLTKVHVAELNLDHGWHHFKHKKVHRRSAIPATAFLYEKLAKNDQILHVEQQKIRRRTKRDFISDFSALEPPIDPLYADMFYLDPAFPHRYGLRIYDVIYSSFFMKLVIKRKHFLGHRRRENLIEMGDLRFDT